MPRLQTALSFMNFDSPLLASSLVSSPLTPKQKRLSGALSHFLVKFPPHRRKLGFGGWGENIQLRRVSALVVQSRAVR